MIRRLLLLEKQLTSSRRNSNMRHNSSHKNHCSSKRIIMLENTTEKLKHGVNFAHRLLGKHHVRTGRRHKALKGSLSLLKRQHVRARRQRLALKKQLRRAVAQQTLLERQVVHLQQMLDMILQISSNCSVAPILRKLLGVLCFHALHCVYGIVVPVHACSAQMYCDCCSLFSPAHSACCLLLVCEGC